MSEQQRLGAAVRHRRPLSAADQPRPDHPLRRHEGLAAGAEGHLRSTRRAPSQILKEVPMSVFQLHVNGKVHTVDIDGNMPLLWALRDILGLKGTKFGCGVAQCGACTVHLDGRAVRSCSVDVGRGLPLQDHHHRGAVLRRQLHPCQKAWVELGVPQCGFCQPGQIMSAAALLARTPASPMTQRSTPRCAATSAAAAPIRGSETRFAGCGGARHHEHEGQAQGLPPRGRRRQRSAGVRLVPYPGASGPGPHPAI